VRAVLAAAFAAMLAIPAAPAAADPSAIAPPRIAPAATAATVGGTELYGYLPYWQMSASMADYLRGVQLTSLELFSVTNNRNGAINHGQTGYKRVTGAIGARLIAEAHARGTRVEVVFTSFGFDRNAALFAIAPPVAGDPRWRTSVDERTGSEPSLAAARTARDLAALVERLGLDGVNVDVEQIAQPAYPGFSAFLSALRARLDAVRPGLRISVATMANQAGANLAGVAVSSGADRIFLMGYDFHWSGSDPGASTPIDRLDGGPSLTSAIGLYRSAGIPADRILLGLPLYGMAWPVASPDRYAERIGPGRAWLPSKHVSQLSAPGFAPHLDPLEDAEYLSQVVPPVGAPPPGTPPTSGTEPPAGTTWRAIFYDSPRTLRSKLALARASGYAGGGFWALGYERGLPGYAQLMADFMAGRVDPTPADLPDPPGSAPLCRGLC